MHGFVYLCPADEVVSFTESLDFLSLVAGAHVDAPLDDANLNRFNEMLRQLVLRLRDKLEKISGSPTLIETITPPGYVLRAAGD